MQKKIAPHIPSFSAYNIVATPTELVIESCMGWLRLVGSVQVKVSNAKEPYKRDDILQKRLTISRSLLIIATPYHIIRSARSNEPAGHVTYIKDVPRVE